MIALNEKYIEKAEINGNPLINALINDYENEFKNKIDIRKPTILCGVEGLIVQD